MYTLLISVCLILVSSIKQDGVLGKTWKRHVRKSLSHPEWGIHCSAEITKAIIDPHPTYQTHTDTQKSMRPKCNFHANFEHPYKKISIFSVSAIQSLCFFLTFWFIYTFYLFFLSPHRPPSFHLFLVSCLNPSLVHWPECVVTGLFYPPVLVPLFIHLTSCPFASSSSVLRRHSDVLDSRHIQVAQALIVCQPLRQHH